MTDQHNTGHGIDAEPDLDPCCAWVKGSMYICMHKWTYKLKIYHLKDLTIPRG